MMISRKEITDLISLSILAVTDSNDPTRKYPKGFEIRSVNSINLDTAFKNEVYDIVKNETFAEFLNDHIGAIRMGMRIQKNREG